MNLSGSVCLWCQCSKYWDLFSFCSSLESVYFILVNLEILDFKPRRVSQVKKFCTFLCLGRCKSQGSLKLFPWCVIQLSGACDPVFSRVCSRFTIGSGCNLMTARWQVFSFLSWLGVHQLTLEGFNCWFHFSGLPLVRNLTNIWETFRGQTLLHGAVRFIPDQAKLLDVPLQVLNFGLDPHE